MHGMFILVKARFIFCKHLSDLFLEYVITGIKKSSEEYKMKDTCTNILLCVTGLWDDVRISMLSDEDFAEVLFS